MANEKPGESLRRRTACDVPTNAALVLLGLLGIAIVLLSTSRYGVGTFTDAEHHLSAARSLLAGQGYRYTYGGLYTQWPPLFPTLLAAIGLVGIDPQVGARLLNSAAFGFIVFFSGRLFLRCTRSRGLVLVGALSVLASGPLMDWCVMAASEPVFVLLVTVFGLCVPRYLRGRDASSLVLISILAALACLQRYAGISLILAGVLLIGFGGSRASLLRRLKHVAIFVAISATPVALWCLRNRMLAKDTVGGHQFHLMSYRAFLAAFEGAAQSLGAWLLPWTRAEPVRPIHLGLAILLAATMIVLSRVIPGRLCRSRGDLALDGDREDAGGHWIGPVAVIGATYLGFVVLCGAALSWRPEQRHMIPIYPLVMAFMVAGIEGVRRLSSLAPGHGKLAGSAVIILCALWLREPLDTLHDNTARRMEDGAGGYSTSAWRDSPLVTWLRSHPQAGRVFSNAPDVIYLLTGAVTSQTPHAQYELDPKAFAAGDESQASYIVWFHGLYRPWLYDLRELLSCCRVQEVATFREGGIYRYLGPSGPGAWAVYRFWAPKLGRHLYTIRKAQRDRLLLEDGDTWKYEGPVFYAYAPDEPRPQGVLPVYQFSSPALNAQFYTMGQAEKDSLLGQPSGVWTCEGIAFYAWPQAGAEDILPVYRFWSQRLGCHFYTISEVEKAGLIGQSSDTWTYECIAWYAGKP